MKKKKVLFLIESENGHDEKLVPEDKVVEEAKKELIDGKWVTAEKKDGTSEILTSDDLDDEDKALMKEASGWKDTFGKDKKPVSRAVTNPTTSTLAKKFENVASVTSTTKAKGG